MAATHIQAEENQNGERRTDGPGISGRNNYGQKNKGSEEFDEGG